MAMIDIHRLFLAAGCERTEAENKALFAGFELAGILPLATLWASASSKRHRIRRRHQVRVTSKFVLRSVRIHLPPNWADGVEKGS